ncbi:MAG TPA: hypothetical protein VGA78_06095, partial [Gemmatimonadales bacterium]
MPSSRHPLNRALEAFGVLSIVATAVVTAVLVIQAEYRIRVQEQGRRLQLVARATVDLLDLLPEVQAATVRALPDRVTAALHDLARGEGDADGISVTAEGGRVLWA